MYIEWVCYVYQSVSCDFFVLILFFQFRDLTKNIYFWKKSYFERNWFFLLLKLRWYFNLWLEIIVYRMKGSWIRNYIFIWFYHLWFLFGLSLFSPSWLIVKYPYKLCPTKVYLIYNDDPATIKGFQNFFQIYSCFSFILFVDLGFLHNHKLAHGSPMVLYFI